jgi:16S rRNA (guanine966-N2)-methyltransferase
VPKGSAIRPTTGLVRGAIFSMLAAQDRPLSRVLELYAGTGALGIEALSRGAEKADFVERDERCCAAIKENLASMELAEKTHVFCCDVTKALVFLEADYDIIMLDPPYNKVSLDTLLSRLVASKAATASSTIVVQHSFRQQLQPNYNGMVLIRQRRYGDTCVSMYNKEAQV